MVEHKLVAARVVAAFAALALVGGFAAAVQPEKAEALSGSEFNPGNIISDALFYDDDAMTQAEIQSFLEGTVGSCRNGLCLNVLTNAVAGRDRLVSQTTGNLVCEAFQGGTLAASAIIYRAQVACGISAKVILVTLQKEQGLLTDTAPLQSELDRAMGMACPDTAPCAAYALGFGNQIYEAARQLKIYKAGAFAKQPGTTTIAYNPNSSCGAGTVTIENYATAALYNYTPYQPNAAALANLNGVGDGCSSYGNRNFWTYYNNWFGSTQSRPSFLTDTTSYVMTTNAAGVLTIYPGNGKGSWLSPIDIGQGWQSMKWVFGAGDFTGDGHRDLIAEDSAGTLWVYPTDGRVGWGTPLQISTGWGAETALFSPGDWNGDGFVDLISRDAAGALWLHPGTGYGALGTAIQIGNGWNMMTSIFAVGDFNGDGPADLMAKDTAGNLWLYAGNGGGGWLGTSRVGNGWTTLDSLVSPGDFNGDGTSDVTARDPSGSLWLYPGNGRGSWLLPVRIGVGWSTATQIIGPGAPAGRVYSEQAGAGDLTGDSERDVITTSGGDLWVYPGNGRGGWLAPSVLATGWSAYDQTAAVGDFDGDGLPNIVARDTSGVLWLFNSTGQSGLGAPTSIGPGWAGMDLVLGAGDITGDRNADILARDTAGGLWLFAGTGSGGVQGFQQVGSGWAGMTSLFNVGDFNGDGSQDLLARDASGALWLYPGTGDAGWGSRVQVGAGWASMTSISGPGDFDGDSRPDVLARDARGGLWLYPGDGYGSWLAPKQIGVGWQAMSSIG